MSAYPTSTPSAVATAVSSPRAPPTGADTCTGGCVGAHFAHVGAVRITVPPSETTPPSGCAPPPSGEPVPALSPVSRRSSGLRAPQAARGSNEEKRSKACAREAMRAACRGSGAAQGAWRPLHDRCQQIESVPFIDSGARAERDRSADDHRLVQQLPLLEPPQIPAIEQGERLLLDDVFCNQFADHRRHHEAVPHEAARLVEGGDVIDRADDRVLVGGDVVAAGPLAEDLHVAEDG